MRIVALLGLIGASLISTQTLSTQAIAVEDQVLKELVPTGKLRVGVAYAPAPTPIFVAREAGGVRGPAFDIGNALARKLGVPVDLHITATTGELTDAVSAGIIDIGFMPADDARKQRLDFSPPYFVIESTYLAGASTGIATMGDVDRAGVKVAGIDGSTTMRAATRSLKQASVVTAKSVDEAVAMMKSGDVQAFALTHDALPKLQKQLPGSRILDGAFQTVGVAIGIQKNRPAALGYVKTFIEDAKKDGSIRKSFDDAGLNHLSLAP
ncbi:MAG: transporter substrate-binding domain-containing protein [Rhizobiales bacterium]|nr:transporter substrate-binding domain-containing protein [Hyphomicrobiales bacterium]